MTLRDAAVNLHTTWNESHQAIVKYWRCLSHNDEVENESILSLLREQLQSNALVSASDVANLLKLVNTKISCKPSDINVWNDYKNI